MNRKRVRRISLIVVLFLALGALWTALQGGPKSREHAAALFQQNRSAFDFAAAQAVERGSGQGIPRPFGVQDVTFWDYEGTAVEFSMDFRQGRLALGGERRGQPLLHPGAG